MDILKKLRIKYTWKTTIEKITIFETKKKEKFSTCTWSQRKRLVLLKEGSVKWKCILTFLSSTRVLRFLPSSSVTFYRSFESHGILHESLDRSGDIFIREKKKKKKEKIPNSKCIRGILSNAQSHSRRSTEHRSDAFWRGTGEFGRTVNKTLRWFPFTYVSVL